jgi:hypothetical protein
MQGEREPFPLCREERGGSMPNDSRLLEQRSNGARPRSGAGQDQHHSKKKEGSGS